MPIWSSSIRECRKSSRMAMIQLRSSRPLYFVWIEANRRKRRERYKLSCLGKKLGEIVDRFDELADKRCHFSLEALVIATQGIIASDLKITIVTRCIRLKGLGTPLVG